MGAHSDGSTDHEASASCAELRDSWSLPDGMYVTRGSLRSLPGRTYSPPSPLSYFIFTAGATDAAAGLNSRRVYCQNGVAVSGDASSASNVASNCSMVTGPFESSFYTADNSAATFWLPLSTSTNVAVKNGFLNIGGA